MTNDGDVGGERRQLDRRLTDLEKSYLQLSAAVQRVEIEQGHVREVLDSRFRALDKGQELLSIKFDKSQDAATLRFEAFTKEILAMGGDPAQSPAGRVVLQQIAQVTRDESELTARVDRHEQHTNAELRSMHTILDQYQGAIKLATGLGAGGLIAGLLGIAARWAFRGP